MAEVDHDVVQLRDDFYRDSFGKVVLVIISIVTAIALLIGLSLYLHFNQPPPIVFPVDKEWRVFKPVPLDQPYLSTPELYQWLSNVLPRAFIFDFNHYNEQLEVASQYFTPEGWKAFLNQLNIYANYNTVQAYKLFVNATLAGAPYIIQKGLLMGRYAWWVQIAVNINYAGYNPPPQKPLTLNVLIIRVPTINNLNGVGIENVIVAKNT